MVFFRGAWHRAKKAEASLEMIFMIGKGASEIRPVTLSEVTKILEKRQGTAGEFGFEQQTTLDYAKRFSRLKMSDAQEMVTELEALGLKNETAVKVADILPSTKAQLLLILSKEKADFPEKKVAEVEEVVAKFAKKAKKIESKPVEAAQPAATEKPAEEKAEAAAEPQPEDDEGKKKSKKEKAEEKKE
jgi:DNA-directed RNA polymerase subunit F